MSVNLFPVRVLVPISGGKDSQACLKLALETHSSAEVRGLLCDTQWEHPKTIAHVKELRSMYGPVQIDIVTAGSVPDQVIKHNRFPVGGSRFCTEELKIWPTKRYCKALAAEQGQGFEVWYGMRSDESSERRTRYAGKVCDELYPPHEVLAKYPQYLAKAGVMFRLAILDWSTPDVFAYLEGKHNELYDDGFDRVGCFPCLAQGDKGKERAFAYDEVGAQRKTIVIKLAEQTGKSPWTSKGGKQRNEACALMCGG
jgi:3'-phosphoadenosine 5'-phosphosulfate sulfotransferase (PAPS reductase)/FAD synthetase